MTQHVKIPIKVGLQEKYDKIKHDHTMIYICSDTGNMYLGDIPIGGNSGVLFYINEQIPEDFGTAGQRCITPNGVFEKHSDNTWQLFSRWSITSDGELAIDGNVPIATSDKVGFVRSSDELGKVSVDSNGIMSVNGWDNIEVSLNFIYREE